MVTNGSAGMWVLPSEVLPLGGDAVHLWRATLNLGSSRIQAFERTLSADERERASRFHFRRDRDYFIAARGILRAILGQYLKMAPAHLRFHYNPYGKPALAGERGDGLRFNVSHSAGLALYAVAQGREVGIDLERLRPSLAREQIAERVFSPAEVATLRSLPEELQPEAFFAHWTLKEALIKAKGKGLTLALDGFEVAPPSEGQVAGLTIYGHPQEARRWSLLKLSPAPGYLAALAIEGNNWHLQCWQWREGLDEVDSCEEQLSTRNELAASRRQLAASERQREAGRWQQVAGKALSAWRRAQMAAGRLSTRAGSRQLAGGSKPNGRTVERSFSLLSPWSQGTAGREQQAP